MSPKNSCQKTDLELELDLNLDLGCGIGLCLTNIPVPLCPSNLVTCISSQKQFSAASLIVIQRASKRPLRFITPQIKANRMLATLAWNIFMLQAGDIEIGRGPT